MLAEDLSVFLDTDDFCELVTVGAVVGVRAIFDEPYALGNVGNSGMASSQPALTLATADVPTPYYHQPVVVRGVDYVIGAHEPDGTGFSRLLLEKP